MLQSIRLVLLPILFVGGMVAAAQNPVVKVETSLGSFEVELYQEARPVTVANFLKYVNEGFYTDTVFHRIIDNFMIQGGGIDSSGKLKKTHAPIKNESDVKVKNANYHIAMARTQELDSATSQFYINVKDNDFLDANKYCAFGKVISGAETVDKIKAVPVMSNGMEKSAPLEPPVIKSITLKKQE